MDEGGARARESDIETTMFPNLSNGVQTSVFCSKLGQTNFGLIGMNKLPEGAFYSTFFFYLLLAEGDVWTSV